MRGQISQCPRTWGIGSTDGSRYWEAKLAPGHVPSEAFVHYLPLSGIRPLTASSKIENFIRTKYESKRWVMDGPIPDPATLDADDDDVVSLELTTAKKVC